MRYLRPKRITHPSGFCTPLIRSGSEIDPAVASRDGWTVYRVLQTHYGLSGQRINARRAHENGDAELSHGHFKTALTEDPTGCLWH